MGKRRGCYVARWLRDTDRRSPSRGRPPGFERNGRDDLIRRAVGLTSLAGMGPESRPARRLQRCERQPGMVGEAMPLVVAPFCCQIGAVEPRKLAGKFS